MRLLEQIHSQITEAELDLGLQLLACKEPYHRILSLMQHFHRARRSLEKITSRVKYEEYHRICEDYHFQQFQNRKERETVLHPDPEIQSRQNKIANIGRVFLGDPPGILLDVLRIEPDTAVVSLSYSYSIQPLTC